MQGLEYGKKTENQGNEKHTLQHLQYGEKHSNTWKMRNAQGRKWSMGRKMENVENETQTLQDLEYGEKSQ